MWMTILGIIALAIIAALGGYAWRLIKRLKSRQDFITAAKNARTQRLTESIIIIAKAMESGECNHSEGVIRLAKLLMPLGESLQAYPAMAKLYGVVQDMPILDERKTLGKQERMRLDLTRECAEAELQDAIKRELNQLLTDVNKMGIQ